MSADATVHLTGASGRSYSYLAFPITARFKAKPGNVVVVRKEGQVYLPLLVGETENLAAYTGLPMVRACILQQGATHVCIHGSTVAPELRQAEARDLEVSLQPPGNAAPPPAMGPAQRPISLAS